MSDNEATSEAALLRAEIQALGAELAAARATIQRMARAEWQLAAILDRSDDLIYIKDRAGRYLLINPAGAALADRSPADFLGKTDLDIFPQGPAEVVMAEDRHVMEEGGVHHFEVTFGAPEGQPVTYSTTKYPLLDEHGATIGVIGVTRDISRRKQLEEALAAQNAELKKVDRLKSAIVSAVSHEFRTPLTLIKGYTEFLAEAGEPTELQLDFLAKIGHGVDRLERLVSDLLDASSLEAGVFRLLPTAADLAALLRASASELAPLAREAGLALTAHLPDAPVPLELDVQRIEQVVTNLVSNAIKFTPAGGRIDIALRAVGDRTRCEIRDTGIGIPDEYRSRLFERFSRLDNGLRRGGTGLGLSICKALVEAHGGTIGVESEPGRGSTFWFELPPGTRERP